MFLNTLWTCSDVGICTFHVRHMTHMFNVPCIFWVVLDWWELELSICRTLLILMGNHSLSSGYTAPSHLVADHYYKFSQICFSHFLWYKISGAVSGLIWSKFFVSCEKRKIEHLICKNVQRYRDRRIVRPGRFFFFFKITILFCSASGTIVCKLGETKCKFLENSYYLNCVAFQKSPGLTTKKHHCCQEGSIF